MPLIDDIRHIIVAYRRLPKAAQEIVLMEMKSTPETKPTVRGTRRVRQPIGPELEQAILTELQAGPRRLAEIASAVQRAVSSTTNAVRHLVERGLVEREGRLLRLANGGAQKEEGAGENEATPLAERKGRRRLRRSA